MGKVVNTTNLIDTSTCLHTNLDKNMVADNYYLMSIQDKIDYEWEYRANRVDIQEETGYGTEKYTDIESVIESVYDEKNKTNLSDDWKKLIFRNIKHNLYLGKRFKFNLDFTDIEEDKSVWILTNMNKTDATASCVVRRCDNNIGMVLKDGSFHYEPCILETDFKAINMLYDEHIVIAQSQIVMILQYNEYTKKMKINDRFILGDTDLEDRANNDVYKIKAIVKFKSKTTFNVKNNSLVYVGLDRTEIDQRDDLVNRIAVQATDDITPSPYPDSNEDSTENNIKVILQNYLGEEIFEDRILLNNTNTYNLSVYLNNELLDDCKIDYETDLLNTTNDEYYYNFIQNDQEPNEFSIKNIRTYIKDKLKVVCKIKNNKFSEDLEYTYYFELGGLS